MRILSFLAVVAFLSHTFAQEAVIEYDTLESSPTDTAGKVAPKEPIVSKQAKDSTVQAQINPVRHFSPGKKELSGVSSFSYISDDNDWQTTLTLSPGFFVYLSDHIFAGPIVTYTGEWTEQYSATTIGLGVQAGVFFLGNKPVCPFASAAYVHNLFSEKEDYSYYNGSNEDYSYTFEEFVLSAITGIKCRIADNVYVNPQVAFQFERMESTWLRIVTVGVSLSGVF